MGGGVGVGGILLDASVLLAAAVEDDEHCNATFTPVADYLLRKLRYSNIRTGIVYEQGLSAEKVHLLESTAKLHSFDCFSMNVTSIEDTVNEIALAWRETGGRFLLVVSNCNADLSVKLGSRGWLIVVLGEYCSTFQPCC